MPPFLHLGIAPTRPAEVLSRQAWQSTFPLPIYGSAVPATRPLLAATQPVLICNPITFRDYRSDCDWVGVA